MSIHVYCRDCRAVELDSLTVLTATEHYHTCVETVDATVEAVEAVDLTALSRLSSCRALSMTVDTCCRTVEPELRSRVSDVGACQTVSDAVGLSDGQRLSDCRTRV